MNEKVQDFRGLSALLIGNNPEHPGKHLLLTSAFSLGTLIPHCVYGPGKVPARRSKKQSVRIKPLKAHQPFPGDPDSTWVCGPGKEPALITKKQSGRIKPLKSHRPYGRWNRNQCALVP